MKDGLDRRGDPLAILTAIVTIDRPDLVDLVEQIGRRRLTEIEREELRHAVALEFTGRGYTDAEGQNEYGVALNDVIDWLGHQ